MLECGPGPSTVVWNSYTIASGGHGCAQFKSSSSLSHFPSVYHRFRHNYNNPPKHSNHSLTCVTYTIAFRGHRGAQFESSSSLSHFLSYIMGFHITIMIHQNIQTTHSHAYTIAAGGHGCAQFTSSSSLSHFPFVYHGFWHYNNPPKHSNHSLTCITLYTIAFRGHGCAQFESSSSLSHFLSYIMGFHITIIHQNIQTTRSHASHSL